MARSEAERSNDLNIFWLKKHGFLDRDFGSKSGGISWTYGQSGRTYSIAFIVSRENWQMQNVETAIELHYAVTGNEGEKENVDLTVRLTTTKCNFGGFRYWFTCPIWTCGKRVGVLYGVGRYFCCRHCASVAYAAQMYGGRYRLGSTTVRDVERAVDDVKTLYYRGRPTRKYRRYLRLKRKLDLSFFIFAGRYDQKFLNYVQFLKRYKL